MSAPSPTANPDPPQDLGELTRQVHDLQQRVLALEQRLGDGEAEVPGLALGPVSEAAVGRGLPASALPALGRVFLAMAGAYLLRALTDFGAIPPTVGVAIGLIYAAVWLFVAARLPVEQELATVLTCGTSMLIMGPLIWEASERLKVMPTWGGAAVLVGFAWIALTLSWRKRQILISGIACVSSTLIAAALLVATRDLVPFTLALLAIAAALEFAACRDHPTGSRWISAISRRRRRYRVFLAYGSRKWPSRGLRSGIHTSRACGATATDPDLHRDGCHSVGGPAPDPWIL